MANYQFSLPGFEGQQLEVQPPGWFQAAKLLINGEPAPRGPKRGTMLLRANNGTEHIATWKATGLSFDIPALRINDQIVHVVEPLPWYMLLWSALPILLIIIGGLFGAIFGIIAARINIAIFRSQLPMPLRFVVTLVVSIVAIVCYIILAVLITSAL